MEPAAVLHYLSYKGFSTVYFDNGKVIQSFLEADIINELIVTKAPVLIGSGIPLFGYLKADLSFKHIRTESRSIGLVSSYYKSKRS
jgi:dihydrofolate reductase